MSAGRKALLTIYIAVTLALATAALVTSTNELCVHFENIICDLKILPLLDKFAGVKIRPDLLL